MRIERLLKQLKREFIKVNVIQALLDALIFFLVANIVLFFFKIQLIAGSRTTSITLFGFAKITLQMGILGGISVLVAAADLYYRSRQYRLEIFEEENPELREILRTARDNLDQQNIVSQALFEETLEKARKVTSESIIPSKQIIYKILTVGFLSFLTVMSGLADLQVGGQGIDVLENPEQVSEMLNLDGDQDKDDEKNASELYGGDEKLGSTDIDIDFNVTGTGNADEEEFNPSAAPPEEELILDSTGGADTEDIEIAKQYSLAIKELG